MGFGLRPAFDIAVRHFDQGGFDPRLDDDGIHRGPDGISLDVPLPVVPEPLEIQTPQSAGGRMDYRANNLTTDISNYYIELRTRALDAGRDDIVERLDTVWMNFGLRDAPAPGSSPNMITGEFIPQANTLMAAMNTIADEAGLREGMQPAAHKITMDLQNLKGDADLLRKMQTPEPDQEASFKPVQKPSNGFALV